MSASVTSFDAWLDEGRRSAGVLDAVHSAVVVGRDGEAAAAVALGLARAHAERRRVAVADLVGEVGPLQSLVDPNGDPHGISDSFLYGVSLNKIAHQADESGNLFVLPSGSEAVAVEDVFRSDRWRRLAIGFREVGALLLLVAQADTPGLETLVSMVDGTIVVGEAGGALGDAAPPLAVIAPVRRRAARPTPEPQPVTPPPMDGPRRAARQPVPPTPPSEEPAPRGKLRLYIATAILSVAIAGALLAWVFVGRLGKDGSVPPRADSTRAAQPTATTPAPTDSTTTAPADNAPLVVANPSDSSNAVVYSIWVTSANTVEGAMTALDAQSLASMPTVTLSPVIVNGELSYQLLLGAYSTRAQADSLLTALRRRGLIGDSSGLTLRTPYALRVAENVAVADVPARVQDFAKKNIVVYSLSRGDGTVALYTGAFERPEQAAWLDRALRQAGVSPTLVYRTGRSL